MWVGRPIEVALEVGSSNDAVFERAAAGANPGLAIAAERQTASRGRRGRAFECRAGLGLWMSVLLRSPAHPADAPRLSIVAALAAVRAIAEVCGAGDGAPTNAALRPQLKWPNDVILDGRKAAGILVEARSSGSAMFVVAGFGINVHHRAVDFPSELRGVAVSLDEATGASVDRERLAARLFEALEAHVDADAAGSFDLAAAFREADFFEGREVVVRADGVTPVRGRADGIEADGRLRLVLASGETATFRSGEASLREV